VSEAPAPGDHEAGRLAARPATPADTAWPLPPGLHSLAMGDGRDGKLLVPNAAPAGPLPLIVMLHGATGNADRALRRIAPIANSALVLLPESLGRSWDIIEGGYGPDIARLDAALAQVFSQWPIDPTRIAIAGFSDGASYALSLALMNGDLFTHALAFSPGFVAPMGFAGRARLFISHGTADQVLPIDRCGRKLAAQLQRHGYPLIYREFDGAHEVPDDIALTALAFLLAKPAAAP
jgi:phospholipase/carboxylesterase